MDEDMVRRTDVTEKIYSVSSQLLAIAELIRHQRRDPHIDEARICFGIGEILTSLSAELDVTVDNHEGNGDT